MGISVMMEPGSLEMVVILFAGSSVAGCVPEGFLPSLIFALLCAVTTEYSTMRSVMMGTWLVEMVVMQPVRWSGATPVTEVVILSEIPAMSFVGMA